MLHEPLKALAVLETFECELLVDVAVVDALERGHTGVEVRTIRLIQPRLDYSQIVL